MFSGCLWSSSPKGLPERIGQRLMYYFKPARVKPCDISPRSSATSTVPLASNIASNLLATRRRIQQAAQAHGRHAEEIALIAVSKTMPAAAIAAAHAAGQVDFGENYVQEAVAKIDALAELPLRWHFLGRMQSNKTALIARHFDWVHTLDREKTARRLSSQRGQRQPLNLLVQINIDADPAKGGVAPDQAGDLIDAVRGMAGLRVRGLMAILEKAGDPQLSFVRLRTLFDALAKQGGPEWDTLSMGMTHDMEAAIAAGATQVRIGTAIFGPRRQREQDS